MRKPKGWYDSQYDAFRQVGANALSGNRPVKCGDCGWTGKESLLDDDHALVAIQDLEQKLTPGDPAPVGECPNTQGSELCRAFVYYDDIEIIYKRKPDVLEALAECAPPKTKSRGQS